MRNVDHGNLVDSMLGEKRHMEVAQTFFKQAVAVVGFVPDQVTTDGHRSYPLVPSARSWEVRSSIGRIHTSIIGESKTAVESNRGTIRCVVLEPLKQRHASVVTRDELRTYLRPRRTMGELVSLPEQRQAFLQRLAALQIVMQAAS